MQRPDLGQVRLECLDRAVKAGGWATIARTPLADTKLAMRRAAARLVANGFSMSRGLPARHAASTMAGWSIGGTATTTASNDVAGVARPVLAEADQPNAEHCASGARLRPHRCAEIFTPPPFVLDDTDAHSYASVHAPEVTDLQGQCPLQVGEGSPRGLRHVFSEKSSSLVGDVSSIGRAPAGATTKLSLSTLGGRERSRGVRCDPACSRPRENPGANVSRCENIMKVDKPLSCFVIGDGALTIQCCDLLLGRGHQVFGVVASNPEIIRWARERRITLLDPAEDLVAAFKASPFDYLFSIANMRLIPKEILALPRRFAINFHDGPLPRYAGVHATSWALIHNERHHAVSWHEIGDLVDGGRILKQQPVAIAEGETAHSLNTKCFEAGIQSFAVMIQEIESRRCQPREQDLSQRTYFGMYERPPAACLLSWQKGATELAALVRGLEFGPYPNPMGRAKIALENGFVLCPNVDVGESLAGGPPGTITAIEADSIQVATGAGSLRVRQLLTLGGSPLALPDAAQQFGLRLGARLPELDGALLERISDFNSTICRHESFWVRRLQTLNPVSLPYLETPSERTNEIRYASRDIDIPESVLGHMRTKHAQLNPAEFLLAAFAVYVARLGGEWKFDLGLALPELARDVAGLEGVFSPEVPLSVQIDASADFTCAAERVRTQVEVTRRHKTFTHDLLARYPELRSIADLGLSRALRVSAHFGETLDACQIEPSSDLRLLLISTDGHVCRWLFRTAAISESSVKRMQEQFTTLLLGLVADPLRPVAGLPLLSEPERHMVLQHWNKTATRVATDLTVHQAFAQQVERTPDAIALVDRDVELTYRELNGRANQLARHVRNLGVAREMPVAIAMDRSAEMVVGLLGILKAGGAYLPLDPNYPSERLGFMIADAHVSVVLTQQGLTPSLPPHPAHTVRIDTDWAAIAQESAEDFDSGVAPHNLAYVIYTSGSTGKPKGVMVEHRNVVNFFGGMDARLKSGPNATWLAVTSLSFDISVLEIFWTLARGFKVVVYHGDDFKHAPRTGPSAHSSRPIDFSLFYFSADQGDDPANKYRLLLEGARFADQRGFAAVWTPERHFHEFGGLYPNPSVTSAAIAMITKRIQIRSGSVVAPLHTPIRIAEEWSVVDNLSAGRVAISFASGWMPEDFVIKPENYANRKDAMRRYIEVVRKLWRGETVAFASPLGQDVRVRILPRPIQAELPVWITTAGSPETYEMAGNVGANVLTHLLGQTIDEVAKKVALYRKAWSAGGHPGRGKVTLMLHTFVSDSPKYVRDTVRRPLRDYLRTSADLVKKYSWAFPAFKTRGGNVGDVNFAELSSDDMDAVLDFAFDRYFETSGLFGTPLSCVTMIDKLKANDIDEVACLIDFGVSADVVLENLNHLDALREATMKPQKHMDGKYSIPVLIRSHNVTHFQCTPSMASMLMADKAARDALGLVQTVLLGGEAFPASLAAELRGVVKGNILNMYGPTETTIWSTSYQLNGEDRNIPIGRPIANTQIYVCDENLQPVPVGVPGELMIGGAGVARGYLNRPELTGERFIRNPFSNAPDARMYRTGDVVRYRQDGNVEFVGRADHQVKVRGYRIELGEIEAVLNEHPTVSASVVIAREDVPGDKRLVAYVIARGGQNPHGQALREYAKSKLPEYMVPARVIELAAFPHTPSMKIDRKALPAPENDRSLLGGDFEPPRTPVETTLAAIWARTLGLERVGRQENFFDLGGDSLLAVQLFLQIEEEFGKKLSIATLFQAHTLEQLAREIDQRPSTPQTWTSLVAIQPKGSKPRLFFVHGAGGNVLLYRQLAYHLGPGYPFYGLQSRGLDGRQPYLTRVEDMAAHYVKEIRALQRQGPYHLGGYCMGGTVAYEVAQRLREDGQEVSLLALLDTYNYDRLTQHGSLGWRLSYWRQKAVFHGLNIAQLHGRHRLSYFGEKFWAATKQGAARVGATLSNVSRIVHQDNGKKFAEGFLEDINDRSGFEYKPRPYAGRVTLVKPRRNYSFYNDPQMGWANLPAGGLEIIELPVNPGAMLVEPYVRILAERLRACIH